MAIHGPKSPEEGSTAAPTNSEQGRSGERSSRRRMRPLLLLVFVVLAVASCATTPWIPEKGELVCQQDSDCTIENHISCCGCPEEPFAISRVSNDARIDRCSAVCCQCVGRCCLGDCGCQRVSDPRNFHAVCEQNTCVRRAGPAAPAQLPAQGQRP